mmetsp:Transcript_3749/g.5766  ORF Transcript_3749/g.5766 Transcript_3749/m.5766 type:complete len:89 (+) Transcript_3749:439-705(+)
MAHLVSSQTMTGFSIVVISSQKVISCLPHCKATREAARPIVHHFTSAYTRRMPNINVKHPNWRWLLVEVLHSGDPTIIAFKICVDLVR